MNIFCIYFDFCPAYFVSLIWFLFCVFIFSEFPFELHSNCDALKPFEFCFWECRIIRIPNNWQHTQQQQKTNKTDTETDTPTPNPNSKTCDPPKSFLTSFLPPTSYTTYDFVFCCPCCCCCHCSCCAFCILLSSCVSSVSVKEVHSPPHRGKAKILKFQ